jgi:phosphoglycolate phosphatase-like HAD superfamily hydrolase
MKIFGTDYDGVIINIEPQKAHAFGDILQKHWEINSKDASEFWMEKGGTSRRYKFNYFYELRYKKILSNEEYGKIEEEFGDLLKSKYYPSVELLPGTKELLDFASSNFDYRFVSSGVTDDEIKYLARLNGVEKYFNIILGTNEKYLSKHDHFAELLKDKKPHALFFIADGPEDMKVAKLFNATAVGILSTHKSDELFSAGADFVCNDLYKCKSLLEKILQI